MVESGSQLPAVEGINGQFWSQYGDPNDANSFNHSSKILIVRHAESEENKHGRESSVEPGDLSQYTDEVVYQKLLDCHISDEGVKQAKDVQPLMNHFRFLENKVYCSP